MIMEQQLQRDFISAIELADKKSIYQFIKQPIDLEVSDNTNQRLIDHGLQVAAYHGFANIVKLLIDLGAQVNAQDALGNTPLIYAMMGNFNDIPESHNYKMTIQLLLDSGTQTTIENKAGERAFFVASDREKVKTLIQHPAYELNPEYTDSDLAIALTDENPIERYDIDLLLAQGAEVNAPVKGIHKFLTGHAGYTPLMLVFCCTVHASGVAELLLDFKAQVNVKNSTGATVLMLAAALADMPLSLTLLIEHGAAVNMQDQNGWSALMYAAQAGNIKNIHALLGNKADPKLKNKQGETVLTLLEKYHPEKLKEIKPLIKIYS